MPNDQLPYCYGSKNLFPLIVTLLQPSKTTHLFPTSEEGDSIFTSLPLKTNCEVLLAYSKGLPEVTKKLLIIRTF